MKKEDWNDLIGRYVLVKLDRWTTFIYKRLVEDVSPSGAYVKFNGIESWYRVNDLVLIEVFE